MKSLRRRAIAKASGQRYVSYKDGGCTLFDRYGSCGLIGQKFDDETFLFMIKINSKNQQIIES